MIRLGRIATASVLVLSAACGGSGATQPSETRQALETNITIVRLRDEPYSFTYNSGLKNAARLVVRDAVTWGVVWNQIHLGQMPAPQLPSIDFSREMIVVAALGARSSGGYGILLEGASEAPNDGMEVIVESISPGSECLVTAAFTQPVDIARVPVRVGPVSFVERSRVSHCG